MIAVAASEKSQQHFCEYRQRTGAVFCW